VLALWTLVITVATVSRVQHFGAIRAIANIAIGWVMGGGVLAIVIGTFILQPFNIPAVSMTPTLLVGDYFFVSKFAYGYSHFSLPFSPPLFAGRIFAAQPQRGDIAVFRLPRNPAVDYVKRIVGLRGDRLEMKDGVLIINDVPVQRERVEDFIDDETGKAIRRWRITCPKASAISPSTCRTTVRSTIPASTRCRPAITSRWATISIIQRIVAYRRSGAGWAMCRSRILWAAPRSSTSRSTCRRQAFSDSERTDRANDPVAEMWACGGHTSRRRVVREPM
jgi:signal peptidase I